MAGSGAIAAEGIGDLAGHRALALIVNGHDRLDNAKLTVAAAQAVDYFAKPGPKSDAASGVFFFGRRSETKLIAKDMLRYYAAKRSH